MARIALVVGMAMAGALTGGLAWAGFLPFGIGGSMLGAIGMGASLGMTAGNLLASIFMPPHSNAGQPLNDLQVMSSAPGNPIPWGFGGYRIAGNVIWATKIKVKKSQQKSGGKGGPTSTVYTFSVDAAISFGFGPGKITRIWADSKLVYDVTGKGPIALNTGLTSQSKGGTVTARTSPFYPTIYTGTPTQNPDPTMQAADGIENTPAYRDQIYIVLHGFPLADFGNRVPNFRAEITAASQLTYVKDLFPESGLAGLHTHAVNPPLYTQVDPITRTGYIFDQFSEVIQKIDLDVNTGNPLDPWAKLTVYKINDQVLDSNGNVQLCIRNHTSAGSPPTWQTGEMVKTNVGGTPTWQNLGPGPLAVPIVKQAVVTGMSSTDGHIAPIVDTLGKIWIQGSDAKVYCVDPSTFQVIKSFPVPNSPNTYAIITAFQRLKSSSTGKNYLYCTMQDLVGMLVIDCDARTFAVNGEGSVSSFAIPGITSTLPGGLQTAPAIDPSTGVAYYPLIDGALGTDTYISACDPRSGVGVVVNHFKLADSWKNSSNEVGLVTYWHAAEGTLLVLGNQGTVAKVDPTDGTIISVTHSVFQDTLVLEIQKGYDGLVPGDSVLKLVGGSGSGSIVYFDCNAMAVTKTVALSTWLPAISTNTLTAFAFEPLSNSALCTATVGAYGGFSFRLYFDRESVAGQPLSDVLAAIWAKTDADPADLDASRVAGITVRGYPISQITSGAGLIGPLCAAYFFDLAESNNRLVAVPRGQSPAVVIPEADLGLFADNGKLIPNVVQEHDLPLVMMVNYYDPATDYQQAKQMFKRNKRVKKTRNVSSVSLPLTLDADVAAGIAVRSLSTLWAERNQWEINLWRSSYMALDPSDVVQFTYNGSQYQTRLTKIDLGQNRSLKITGVSEDPRQYVKTSDGAVNLGFVKSSLLPIGPTALFIMDMPYVRDSDIAAAGVTGYYWAMSSPTPGATSWPGGILFTSVDNSNFAQQDSVTNESSYGIVVAATPAPPRKFCWDDTTVINVYMVQGTLSGATDLNVLNGANICYLGGELLAFGTATLQSDGTYNLSHLLRGLRGTEGWCGIHQSGENLIVLSDTATQRLLESTSFIGSLQYLRGVTIGNSLPATPSQTFTPEGNDLKPYAPAQFTGSVDGSHNVLMSWVRRTRIGGAWMDGTGTVPVSEESENYDLDIMWLNFQGRDDQHYVAKLVNSNAVNQSIAYATYDATLTQYYIVIQPFTMTWDDGTVATYLGTKIPANDSHSGNSTVAMSVYVHDINRTGDAGGGSVTYGKEINYGDEVLANQSGYYLIALIPQFSAGQPVEYYHSTPDGSGGDVAVRSLSGLPSPSFNYSSAQQTTDFGRDVGAFGSSGFVRGRVFQNSAAVGRGFAATNSQLGSGGVVSGGGDATSILGVPITGTPADGDILQYSAADVAWEIVGPALKRQAIAKTTASLANGAAEVGSIAIACKSFLLLKVQVDRAARVQLYSTAAFRDADAGRVYNAPPSPGAQNGIIADFGLETGGAETWVCSPALLGANADGTPANTVYYRITNASGGTSTVAVTLTIVPVEL